MHAPVFHPSLLQANIFPGMRLSLIAALAVCLASSRGVDLEAALRAKYKETGRVSSHSAYVAGMPQPLHYLAAGPEDSAHRVVLLHGMAFSSATWKVVGTLDALARAGHRVVALDFNGYSPATLPRRLRPTVLASFIDAIGWGMGSRVLVVAASAGGTVALPFVLMHTSRVSGYVSLSAVLDEDDIVESAVPCLMVWGELDSPNSPKAAAHEKLFRLHTKVVIPDAPHPSYLAQPEQFNHLLLQFAGAEVVEGSARAMAASAAWHG